MDTKQVKSVKKLRAILFNRAGQFLVMLNNNAAPGTLTVMVPGCDFEEGGTVLGSLRDAIETDVAISLPLGHVEQHARLVSNITLWDEREKTRVELAFYLVPSEERVPLNVRSGEILSVSWVRPDLIRERVQGHTSEMWLAQSGLMQAIDAAFTDSPTEKYVTTVRNPSPPTPSPSRLAPPLAHT